MAAPAHAVVIGASIAGLLAAAALSEVYPKVTVYDRDVLPADPVARRGVPQGRHLHGLQARGVLALDELLPGFKNELTAAGGVLCDMQEDMHWYLDDYLLMSATSGLEGIGISRPLLEGLIRSRVTSLANVTVQDDTDVTGLAAADGVVTGVTIAKARTPGAAADEVAADLVVDAAGRGSRTPAWLSALGFPPPEVSRVRTDVSYVSRFYAREPGQLDGRFGSAITPYPGKPIGGAVLRQEGDRWVVLVAGMIGTDPPLDDSGLIAFAERLSCPDIAAVMRTSVPLTEPLKYTYPESVWFHYEALSAYLGGFLVIGDAFCSLNPIYGQGITTAALEALRLRAELRAALPDLALRYFASVGKLVGEAWETSTASDLRFPEIEGKRRPGAGLIDAYGVRFRAAASVDPVLGRTFLRVANMIDKPAKLLSPGTVLRVYRAAGKAVRAGALAAAHRPPSCRSADAKHGLTTTAAAEADVPRPVPAVVGIDKLHRGKPRPVELGGDRQVHRGLHDPDDLNERTAGQRHPVTWRQRHLAVEQPPGRVVEQRRCPLVGKPGHDQLGHVVCGQPDRVGVTGTGPVPLHPLHDPAVLLQQLPHMGQVVVPVALRMFTLPAHAGTSDIRSTTSQP
jgi:2-polyprenyl-6-methoxyphenol hydroxylase-like FAD-dependent oxidoreductase